MADITATQREALSGMNLSDHEKRMKELEAELEAVKARIAETKANIANLKADQKLIESAQATTQDRQLEGERSEDGSLIPAKEFTQEEINQMSTDEMIEADVPVQQAKVLQVETDDVDTDDDIEGDERTDADSERQQFMGILREGSDYEQHGTGRTFAMEDDLPERSMGFEDKDGYMSVNEKDDFWKTQEGYDKAIEMYGSKPAWVKEPTLIWNPSEQEYEEIEEEEFEDLSRPAISSDIKKLFG